MLLIELDFTNQDAILTPSYVESDIEFSEPGTLR